MPRTAETSRAPAQSTGAPETSVLASPDGAVVRVTMERPRQRNCLGEGVLSGLESALDLAEERRAKVVVLRGSGGHFCAGADLSLVRPLIDDLPAFEAYIGRLVAIAGRLESGPFVSVAVVEGFALAGGCELLLACDISLAASDARIGDGHLEYGLAPGAGGSVRLPRALSKARAHYLLLTGQSITGATAADWGLITQAVEPDVLDAHADALVDRLASRSGEALRTVKQMALEGARGTISEGMAAEATRFFDHLGHCPDAREGLTAFAEGRAPCFKS